MNLMTVPEAAEYMRFSPSYLRKLVMNKKVPFFKIGRAVRFDKEELDDFIREGRVRK